MMQTFLVKDYSLLDISTFLIEKVCNDNNVQQFFCTHLLSFDKLFALFTHQITYNYECNFFFKVAKNVHGFVGNNNYS